MKAQRSRVAATSIAAVAAFTVLAACTTAPPPPHAGGLDPDTAPRAAEAAYAQRGPYDVGVLTVEVEPGRSAEVWYPAEPGSAGDTAPASYRLRQALPPGLQELLPAAVDPVFTTEAVTGLPAADGRFPLVLFSHGFASFRTQSSFLTTHLASWGFVVISPDYIERGLGGLSASPGVANRPEPDLVEMTVAAARALDTGTGQLAGRIDTSRLFPIGHSAGGWSSTRLAGERTDVSSWISISFGVSLPPLTWWSGSTLPDAMRNPDKAAMWITGSHDHIVDVSLVETAYAHTSGERKLVIVPRSGHNNAFTDLCEMERDKGGFMAMAAAAGVIFPEAIVGFAQDGCLPPNATGDEAWPIVRHFITAELRYRAGLDATPVGLGSAVTDAFGDMAPTYLHDE